jgi:hypothetical protein
MKRIALITVLIIIIAFVGGFWFANQKPANLGGVYQVPSFNSVTTTQVSAAAATSTIVLTQKGGRAYASICNDTTNAKGYIQLGTTATTSTSVASVVLESGECWAITQDNLYTGQVRYAPEATSTTLQVVEFIGY